MKPTLRERVLGWWRWPRITMVLAHAWRVTRNCPWEHWLIMLLVALFLLALEIMEAIDL